MRSVIRAPVSRRRWACGCVSRAGRSKVSSTSLPRAIRVAGVGIRVRASPWRSRLRATASHRSVRRGPQSRPPSFVPAPALRASGHRPAATQQRAKAIVRDVVGAPLSPRQGGDRRRGRVRNMNERPDAASVTRKWETAGGAPARRRCRPRRTRYPGRRRTHNAGRYPPGTGRRAHVSRSLAAPGRLPR